VAIPAIPVKAAFLVANRAANPVALRKAGILRRATKATAAIQTIPPLATLRTTKRKRTAN
jgi:hypothetical protein